jgi:Phytanoyl-CoA dioxygenase (PhyH)
MTQTFLQLGFESCGQIFQADECKALVESVYAQRDFADLFLDEAAFRANPMMKSVNPRPGRNLLGRMDADFIFGSGFFADRMAQVLGPQWRVLDHKFVMGVPDSWLPAWLQEETKGLAVANLGPYVKPAYRDITYFHGIDFHQDIIDFKSRPCDFVTAYVYLDEATSETSPLYVMPKSHEKGASKFPHNLQIQGDTAEYSGASGGSDSYKIDMLTGPAGSLYFWHASTLHGTMPHRDSQPRISVRILVEKNDRRLIGCELDQVNALIDGPLALEETRVDLDEYGAAKIRGNTINTLD